MGVGVGVGGGVKVGEAVGGKEVNVAEGVGVANLTRGTFCKPMSW